MSEISCALASAERGEDLFGTASQVRRWLLIEVRGAWGHDVFEDSALASHVDSEWRQSLRDAGIRPLAIRRDLDRHDAGAPSNLFYAESGVGPDEPSRAWHRLVPDLATVPGATRDLLHSLAQDPSTDGSGIERSGWMVHEEPVLLVCTNGRHDSCCATYGRPLIRHLRTTEYADAIWESSHVGGDRFAANLVVLPDGYYFGRVPVDHSEALLERLGAGHLDLDHYRGRCTQSFAAQAVEHLVRRDLALTAVDSVSSVSRVQGDEYVVALATGERVSAVVSQHRVESPEPLTCSGAPGSSYPVHRLERVVREVPIDL